MGDQPNYGQPMQPQSAGAKWGATSMGMEAHIAAGLSYFFSPILPLIFFLIEKSNRFVKFHAMQSMILGVGSVVWFIVVGLILPIIVGIIGGGADAATGGTGAISGGATLLSCGLVCVTWVGWLGIIALFIWGMIAGFTGKYTKLPIIGNLAEKWAGGPAQPAF
ncbi:MAG TPA: hypothetical protein VJR48_06160 [Ktedonobacterales bacterium]|nr:hypothetical protein [Ktedonobacterales bacterium]